MRSDRHDATKRQVTDSIWLSPRTLRSVSVQPDRRILTLSSVSACRINSSVAAVGPGSSTTPTEGSARRQTGKGRLRRAEQPGVVAQTGADDEDIARCGGQDLTARENIQYFGSLQRVGGDLLSSRIAELSRVLGMESFIERRAKGFSQGQRIKVALARALVHDPGNVVLDEPTNGLDVMAIRNLREMLLGLKAEGRCVLFSSHVMQEVAALCDRVVIMGDGKILADATLQSIRELSGAASMEEAFLQVLSRAAGVG